jgi:hypothetical protein
MLKRGNKHIYRWEILDISLGSNHTLLEEAKHLQETKKEINRELRRDWIPLQTNTLRLKQAMLVEHHGAPCR